MNKECCRRCTKEVIESTVSYLSKIEKVTHMRGLQQKKESHQKMFDEWFDQLWTTCEGKSPCRWLMMVDENKHEVEWYPPFERSYFYIKRTIPPDNCPYVLEHTVSQ